MSTAPQYRPQYTVDDYMLWEGDWELWFGHPVSMSPSPFGLHQVIVSKLTHWLMNEIDKLSCDATLIPEIDWIVTNDTVVRPELVIVCGGTPERHVESPPAFAVEVISPSSIERDSVYKRDLYRDHGVGNYLIVDPQNGTLCLHRQSNDWQAEVVENMLHVLICETCELNVDVSKLFD
jgi:Uma2 family endonuclease